MPDYPEPQSVGASEPGRGALGRHRLGPHVVGERVVVRHLLPDGRATDVLGVCTSWGDGVTTIESDHGPVTIAIPAIVTGKPVPPRASVRSRVRAHEVELHSFAGWSEITTETIGEWVVRIAPPMDGRLVKRANSCLAMGDPGVAVTEAAAAVEASYTSAGRRPMVQVERDGEFASTLQGLGWQPLGAGDSLTQLVSTGRALRACTRMSPTRAERVGGVEVEEPVSAFESHDAGRLRVETAGRTARGGATLDGDWLWLHGLHVTAEHRRRGLAVRVLAELLDWGASLGATTAAVHVEDDNAAARKLYEALGFVTHHANRYLTC